MTLPKYITDVRKIENISNEEKKLLKRISEKFVFRANDYYLSLIDWEDPMILFAAW